MGVMMKITVKECEENQSQLLVTDDTTGKSAGPFSDRVLARMLVAALSLRNDWPETLLCWANGISCKPEEREIYTAKYGSHNFIFRTNKPVKEEAA